MKKEIVIIGAGMAGCFMAVCLAKRGYNVHIYENRPDVRKQPYDSGRSFNLTLYYRGIQAMKKVDIWEQVKKIAIIAEGNEAHYGVEKNVYDPFDSHGDEILYTVHRNQLNGALLDVTETFPNITTSFNTKCLSVDSKTKTATFQKEGEKKPFTVQAEIIIGADGIHSVIRTELQKNKKDSAVKQAEDWGYKEVHISAALTKEMNLRTQATHTWPRDNSLLIAFPNPDESFTLMFNLPLEGKNSFTKLQTKEQIETFITTQFPDLQPLLTDIVHSFLNRPTGKFITLYADQWHNKNSMVVIGDAAHAVIPFYGQGVCAAFEDSLLFAELVDAHKDDWETIFAKFQENRKINTDLLARLSKENFIELRDKSRSPYHIVKDKADTLLHTLFPKLWLPPLYILIAHGSLEYREALRIHARQQRISRRIGLDLALHVMASPWILLKKLQRTDS